MKSLMLAATAALAVAAAIEPADAWMRAGGGFGGSWGHTAGGGFYHAGDAGGFSHATEVGAGGVAHESDAGGAWHGSAANGYGAYHGGDYGGYYPPGPTPILMARITPGPTARTTISPSS